MTRTVWFLWVLVLLANIAAFVGLVVYLCRGIHERFVARTGEIVFRRGLGPEIQLIRIRRVMKRGGILCVQKRLVGMYDER